MTMRESAGLFGIDPARWGVDPEVARQRLRVCSLVSTRHRYLYVMTPKAGCTTVKHLIAALEDLPLQGEVLPRRHRESKPEQLIHDQRALPLPDLTSLPPQQASLLLQPESGYLVFAFVRNPYSRLFSAWNNKIRFIEPGFAPLVAHIRQVLGLGDEAAPLSFAEFVSWVCHCEDPYLSDHHWALQSALLFPDAIPYRFICPIEQFEQGWSQWRQHLERQTNQPVVRPPAARNRSLPENWRRSYDAALADQVYHYYQEDFVRFGYQRDSWQAGAEATPQTPQADGRDFAHEIIARNRMIDLLYDKLDSYADILDYYRVQLRERNRQLDQVCATMAGENLQTGTGAP